MQNILIILALILVIFFLSEDQKLNSIMKKQSVPFIIILALLYFFFNKIDIKLVMLSIIITVICSVFNLSEYVYRVYQTITLIAMYSLGFRRLKDAGISGFWFLIPLINLVLATLPKKVSLAD